MWDLIKDTLLRARNKAQYPLGIKPTNSRAFALQACAQPLSFNRCPAELHKLKSPVLLQGPKFSPGGDEEAEVGLGLVAVVLENQNPSVLSQKEDLEILAATLDLKQTNRPSQNCSSLQEAWYTLVAAS